MSQLKNATLMAQIKKSHKTLLNFGALYQFLFKHSHSKKKERNKQKKRNKQTNKNK